MKVNSLIKKIRLLFAEGEEGGTATTQGNIQEGAEPQAPPPIAHPPLQPPAPTSAANPVRQEPRPVPPRPPARPATPQVVVIGIKEQAEWMLQQIGENAKTFVAFAEKNGYLAKSTGTVQVLARTDVTALMLGFKVVSTAFRVQHKEPSREVLRMVKGAMVSMLLKAGRDHAHQAERERNPNVEKPRLLTLEDAEEHVKSAEPEIAQAIAATEAKTESALDLFCAGLAPAFGEAATVSSRYSPTVHELYIKSQQSLVKQFGHAAALMS